MKSGDYTGIILNKYNNGIDLNIFKKFKQTTINDWYECSIITKQINNYELKIKCDVHNQHHWVILKSVKYNNFIITILKKLYQNHKWTYEDNLIEFFKSESILTKYKYRTIFEDALYSHLDIILLDLLKIYNPIEFKKIKSLQ